MSTRENIRLIARAPFKLGYLMENPLFKIAFLNDLYTLEICPSHFWLSRVKTTFSFSRFL